MQALSTCLGVNDSLLELKLGGCELQRGGEMQGIHALCQALHVNRGLASLDLQANLVCSQLSFAFCVVVCACSGRLKSSNHLFQCSSPPLRYIALRVALAHAAVLWLRSWASLRRSRWRAR
jgi:hypothetical protein